MLQFERRFLGCIGRTFQPYNSCRGPSTQDTALAVALPTPCASSVELLRRLHDAPQHGKRSRSPFFPVLFYHNGVWLAFCFRLRTFMDATAAQNRASSAGSMRVEPCHFAIFSLKERDATYPAGVMRIIVSELMRSLAFPLSLTTLFGRVVP